MVRSTKEDRVGSSPYKAYKQLSYSFNIAEAALNVGSTEGVKTKQALTCYCDMIKHTKRYIYSLKDEEFLFSTHFYFRL